MEQILHGGGGLVVAEEHRRLVGVDDEWLGPAGVLPAGAVELLDRRAAVTAVDPLVARAELKACQRGVGADVVDRSGEAVDVDAVDGMGDLHGLLLCGGVGRYGVCRCAGTVRKERFPNSSLPSPAQAR